MYEVIYMKADFEPWWQFDGWEEEISERWEFADLAGAKEHMQRLKEEFSLKYPHDAAKDGKFYAFWTDAEKVYCEACEEDLQVYHGLLIRKSGKVEKCF